MNIGNLNVEFVLVIEWVIELVRLNFIQTTVNLIRQACDASTPHQQKGEDVSPLGTIPLRGEKGMMMELYKKQKHTERQGKISRMLLSTAKNVRLWKDLKAEVKSDSCCDLATELSCVLG